MLAVIIISLAYYTANCNVIPIIQPSNSKELVKCVTDIVTKYFAPQIELTYVGNKLDDDEFLKAIHESNSISMMSRRSSRKLPVAHQGYFISARNYSVFTDRFPNLSKESTWNPDSRFLIVVKSLKNYQLRHIFNRLLKYHVNNVIVVNGSAEAHLYAYNPFDNYACGKWYDHIINYGKCSEAHKKDIFPEKFITGLQNCTFNVAVPHWPPFTLFPTKNATSPLSYGIEPYLLQLIGKVWGFNIKIILEKENNDSFSTVSADMEAFGSLKLIQDNKADVLLGGLLLIPSRAFAFNYIHDLLPYVDELRWMVKRATIVPVWKNVYLEFDATVWVLITISLMLYSATMILLLRVEDKSHMVLKLLENLVLHGCNLKCQWIVKCIFILWVWFAYLINAFYQSSLVSLTMNPAMENQISTEAGIVNHKLQPCFSEVMSKYYIESTQSNQSYTPTPGCEGTFKSLMKVSKSKDLFTMFLYGLYRFNRYEFYDEYGVSEIYALKKPYSKVIYSMYFYRGFPLIHEIRLTALELREMGLVNKAIWDMNYMQKIKHNFHAKTYGSRFVIPWHVYIFGCIIATITFILEILNK